LVALREERGRIEAQLASGPNDLQTGLDVFRSTLNLLNNPQALYTEAPVSGKKIINKAIFTKLYIDDLDGVAQVTNDELNEPYATVLYARRAEGSLMAPTELRQAVDEALRAARRQPGAHKIVGYRKDGLTAVPRFTAAASLVCHLRGQGSSKADLVELWGLEPQTSCMPCRRSSQLSYSPKKMPRALQRAILPDHPRKRKLEYPLLVGKTHCGKHQHKDE
jgi:hypothetical protein